jgi:molybdate transport system substrate-binding protein
MPLRTGMPILVFALLAACARAPHGRELTVAAASDLNFAMNEISRGFERAYPGARLRASYGSSGNFYAQVANGAPYDVFLSADVEYPRRLAEGGVGLRDSLFVYAVGRLVLWVPAGSKLDPATALRDGAIRRLAIANPRHAPYGRAAEAALRSLGLYGAFENRLALGDNIAQTMEFAASGAADAGMVALSLATAPPARGGRYWEIPPENYPRIEQGGLIVKDSPEARGFRAFLLSGAGRAILKRHGFSIPEER